MIVKQVVDFSTVDFVHRDCHSEVALVILPKVDATFEKVLHCQVLKTLHCECLA